MTMCLYANIDINDPKHKDMMKKVHNKMYTIHKLTPGLSSLPDDEIRKLMADGKVKGVE